MIVLGGAHTVRGGLGFLAVILATLNVVGGFVVTDRMLEMFKSKPGDRPKGLVARADRAARAGRAREPRDGHRPLLPDCGNHLHPGSQGSLEPQARPAGHPRRPAAWRSPSGPLLPARALAHLADRHRDGHRRGHRRAGGAAREDDRHAQLVPSSTAWAAGRQPSSRSPSSSAPTPSRSPPTRS